MTETRPDPADVSDEVTLLRWYWLRDELATIARRLGLSASGGKHQLTSRIADHLAGRPPIAAPPRAATHDRLPDALTGSTVIEPGQRCTQRLREWMRERTGAGFTFDAPMREAVAAGGLTLDGLVAVWRSTRHRPPGEISAQFEFNRFARACHAEHADGDRDGMLRAWRAHRDSPRDVAGGVAGSDDEV